MFCPVQPWQPVPSWWIPGGKPLGPVLALVTPVEWLLGVSHLEGGLMESLEELLPVTLVAVWWF